jgi:hypothetical protein
LFVEGIGGQIGEKEGERGYNAGREIFVLPPERGRAKNWLFFGQD